MSRFEVEPRAESLGGGWRLRLIDDDGEEAGGGVFPAGDDGYADAYEEGSDWLQSRGGDGSF